MLGLINYGVFQSYDILNNLSTGVKFSLTPLPRCGTPRGAYHNGFPIVKDLGGVHMIGCCDKTPLPFVMDYQYRNIE